MDSGTASLLRIRSEQPGDRPLIRGIVAAAFGRTEEANLVDSLYGEHAVLASFVADYGGRPVGHVLFSRMHIDDCERSIPAVALAPMAVEPAFQRQGIGGELIRHGLDWLRGHGEAIAVVLGHPAYYPRFGFRSEAATRLESPFARESFMALELVPGALDGVRGRVRYPKAFGL